MEGNQMKIREALVAVQKKIEHLCGSFNVPNSLVAGRMEINGIINAAISEPPRQCDVGTAEEQHRRFIDYCNTCDCPMGCIHRKEFTGMLDTRCASMLKCYIRWAQTPYDANEGGAE